MCVRSDDCTIEHTGLLFEDLVGWSSTPLSDDFGVVTLIYRVFNTRRSLIKLNGGVKCLVLVLIVVSRVLQIVHCTFVGMHKDSL